MNLAPPIAQLPLLSASYFDVLTPGVQVELDAGEAEALGLVEETALTEPDAWDSNADLFDGPTTNVVDLGIAANDDEDRSHG